MEHEEMPEIADASNALKLRAGGVERGAWSGERGVWSMKKCLKLPMPQMP
jgi:hypothetical protein